MARGETRAGWRYEIYGAVSVTGNGGARAA